MDRDTSVHPSFGRAVRAPAARRFLRGGRPAGRGAPDRESGVERGHRQGFRAGKYGLQEPGRIRQPHQILRLASPY
ncbi:protein of unknown function [Streptomyces murinus]